MKKIVSALLLLSVLFTFVSCLAINRDGEVSVLWSDHSNSLLFTTSDALDRAMYIENIRYTHYDAKGDAKTQLEQADTVLQNGAAALVVHPTDPITAEALLKKAQEADIPIVFLCYDLPEALLSSYDKCFSVNVDLASLYPILGERIATDLIESKRNYDRNGDGIITYVAFGASNAAISIANALLEQSEKPTLSHTSASLQSASDLDIFFREHLDGDNALPPIELILTDDDEIIDDLLLTLRKYEFNHKKLVTHYIPLYTVGNSANAGALIDSKNEEERAAYSVMNAIDNGFLSAAALEDNDALARTVAAILRNFFKGNAPLDGIDMATGRSVTIPYTIYEAS